MSSQFLLSNVESASAAAETYSGAIRSRPGDRRRRHRAAHRVRARPRRDPGCRIAGAPAGRPGPGYEVVESRRASPRRPVVVGAPPLSAVDRTPSPSPQLRQTPASACRRTPQSWRDPDAGTTCGESWQNPGRPRLLAQPPATRRGTIGSVGVHAVALGRVRAAGTEESRCRALSSGIGLEPGQVMFAMAPSTHVAGRVARNLP